MTVTVSVVVGLAFVAFLLIRHAGLRTWHAMVCVVLGFYLASSAMSGSISEITRDFFNAVEGLG